MAQSLKVHAFEMRAARLLRAEEKAHKIPTKLAFPLMLGLIPVIMMITLGPAIVTMVRDFVPLLNRGTSRSEEHKSELQSLMRISYAVFCLKKKNNYRNNRS